MDRRDFMKMCGLSSAPGLPKEDTSYYDGLDDKWFAGHWRIERTPDDKLFVSMVTPDGFLFELAIENFLNRFSPATDYISMQEPKDCKHPVYDKVAENIRMNLK